jgi:hypothetical protein
LGEKKRMGMGTYVSSPLGGRRGGWGCGFADGSGWVVDCSKGGEVRGRFEGGLGLAGGGIVLGEGLAIYFEKGKLQIRHEEAL